MDCPRDSLTPPIYIEKSLLQNKGYRPFYCEYLFFPVGEDAFEEVLAWSFRIERLGCAETAPSPLNFPSTFPIER